MRSLRLALFLCLLGSAAGAFPPPGLPPLPALGPIPTEKAAIEGWVDQWPRWVQERARLGNGLQHLRERLRDQGEAEARRGQRPPWWNLPQRQQQNARLRYLQRLRMDLEDAQARLFQAQAVEAQWIADLENRKAKRRLAPALRPVLDALREQAEKDNKDREESD